MGQIIIPGGGGSSLTQAISDDVIAYYKFEETLNLAVALDSKMNFNAVVPATHDSVSSRTAGKIGQGLVCGKGAIGNFGGNFDCNMLLDEIPSTHTVTVEMWLKLTEAIKKGEHGTYTIFSKQWASGMKWYAYIISRLESVSLRVCLSYSNADASARTLLFAGATGGSFAANGIYYKASTVKYIQAIDPTWTIEYDGLLTKWQVKKRDTLGVQVTHFEINPYVAGSYDATIYGEGTTVTATALIARQDEYEIDCGELAAGTWHKLYLLLDLREDYISKFGIYFDAQYAGGDTAYLVDLPLNTVISPDLLGGDAANVKLATDDGTIPYIVDGYPFPSSHRYGLPAIIDEVIVSRILMKQIVGSTEKPKLFLSSQGLGSAAAVPVETDYDFGEHVALTATGGGGVLVAWMVNGVDMGDANPYDLVMTPGDKTVVAIFNGKVATPTVDIPAGNYSIEQLVTISCFTAGAAIYYTTNGDTPDSGDTLYTVPVSVAEGLTLKAIGILGGQANSDVMSEVYTFTLPAPLFNPDGGSYGAGQSVEMTDLMAGATIRYTTDGSEPGSGDTIYTVPVVITVSGTTVKAKAFKTNCTTSSTKTAVYVLVNWLRKTDIPVVRAGAVAFAVGIKGYFGSGYVAGGGSGEKDFYEYDPATNAWMSDTDCPEVSWGGKAVTVGTKGYLYLNNGAFYEYDRATGTGVWTKKQSPPIVLFSPFMFEDGTYLYVGGGFDVATNHSQVKMYRYNPATDTWTQKADFPTLYSAFGIAMRIGSKCYAGLGAIYGSGHSTVTDKSWFEYDPAIDTWTSKLSFPPFVPGIEALCFASATAGYYVVYGPSSGHMETWKYTPGTNTWVQVDDFPGSPGSRKTSCVIDGKGYCGGGDGINLKEWYAYLAL